MTESNLFSNGKCDICSSPISVHNSFGLPTKTVVTGSRYWEKFIELFEKRSHHIPNTPFEIFQTVIQLTGQKTIWMVCEKCSELYQFDKDIAKKIAETWWVDKKPIFCGSLCVLSANGRNVDYIDKDAFDLAYTNAREAFSKYQLQKLYQHTSTHPATPENLNESTMLLDKIMLIAVDIRESDLFRSSGQDGSNTEKE